MDNPNPIPRKIYTSTQIELGTFFGGPLASGILLAKNYKLFGKDEAARKSIYIGILITLILGLFLYLASNSLVNKIPNQTIPLINVGVVYLIIHFFQKDKINNHLREGGAKESYWKTIGIGFLCLIVTLSVLIIPLVNKPPYDGQVKYFGKAKNSIYYDSIIPTTDIDTIGNTLTNIGLLNDKTKFILQIREEKVNVYNIYITVTQKGFYDQELVTVFKRIGKIIQQKFANKKIEISLLKEGLSKTETKRIL